MSNSGKGSGKLPKRTHNPKRIAGMAASYRRGQERKEARRAAQKQRERVNEQREPNELTPFQRKTVGQKHTRNKHYNVGTASFVVSSPLKKLAKGQMNPGRSVGVSATTDRKGNITGWSYSCLNCSTRKAYTNEHFHDPYGTALAEGGKHMCAPQSWYSPYKELLASR